MTRIDVVEVVGVGAVLVGLWMIFAPLALITAGVGALLLARGLTA